MEGINKIKNQILISIILTLISCSSQEKTKTKLIIFHAGSLSLPFKKIEDKFEALHPDVDILREPAGSVNCARKITDLKKPCDIMASSDYKVINKFLIPDYADWNIYFANNQIVLCYTKKSRYTDTIDQKNWYEIIQKKDVSWGHADPNVDPCGYRSLMVIQLAEKHYKIKGLYEKIMATRDIKNVRPKSEDMISLLETGNMDYAWEYLSVAIQHELKYVKLPNQINLGNQKFDHFYKKANLEIDKGEPGKLMKLNGNAITYGITILKDAPNKELAVKFLEFLLDPDNGLKVLNDSGQPPIIPCEVPTRDMKNLLPKVLKELVKVKQL